MSARKKGLRGGGGRGGFFSNLKNYEKKYGCRSLKKNIYIFQEKINKNTKVGNKSYLKKLKKTLSIGWG